MDNLNRPLMDNLNNVISLVMECGMVGSQLTIEVDTDYLPAWGMYIKTEGGSRYHLSTNDNGGYLLQALVSAPHMLVTSGPQGVIGITRDPELGVCQIYMPRLDRETLIRSLQSLRINVNRVRRASAAPMNQQNHNNN
ncbi:hypothetical protein [Microcoleus phage My-WqHQDG]|nr:hypothetical protein [Microcoleus phage My-WqHQDG]